VSYITDQGSTQFLQDVWCASIVRASPARAASRDGVCKE